MPFKYHLIYGCCSFLIFLDNFSWIQYLDIILGVLSTYQESKEEEQEEKEEEQEEESEKSE